MIFLLCLAIMSDSGQTPGFIANTELYKPMRIGDVAVSPQGHVYIVDFDQARILHYDGAGKRLADIGRKGKGPGEFQNPSKVWYEEGQIFVHDAGAGAVTIFKPDGTYVERVGFQSVPRMTKIPGGWLMMNVYQPDGDGNITLYQVDNLLKNKVAIITFPKTVDGGNITVEMDGSSVPKVPYNPVADDYQLVGNPNSKYAYLSYPGNLKIDVIDTETKKVARTIQRDLKAIPFNQDWGKARLDSAKEGNKKMGAGFEFVANFPETFPLVRNVSQADSGELILELWTGFPDERVNALAMNHKGEDATWPYKTANHSRVMAILGETAYVSTYGSEDEAGMVTCKLSEVDEVVKANPIQFEGPVNRMIMRMN